MRAGKGSTLSHKQDTAILGLRQSAFSLHQQHLTLARTNASLLQTRSRPVRIPELFDPSIEHQTSKNRPISTRSYSRLLKSSVSSSRIPFSDVIVFITSTYSTHRVSNAIVKHSFDEAAEAVALVDDLGIADAGS